MTQDEKLDLILAEVSSLKTDVSSLKTDVSSLKTDVSSLKSKVSSLELTVENVTNRNIEIIAEGHLDIIRKLNDALKVTDQKESMLIRTNIMENEIRIMKDKLASIS